MAPGQSVQDDVQGGRNKELSMRIGLIDVDGHNYPNLALMKISAYHKRQGDEVEWYQPPMFAHYDIVYKSKVFSDTYTKDVPDPINTDQIIKGGTGYAIKLENGREVYHKELDPPLSPEIEKIYPDYSIYPEFTGYGEPLSKQTAYGFLTRGCPRGCGFCHVAPKEGKCSVKVADLKDFWGGQGNIVLNDPNILACKDAPDLLGQLVESKALVEFNQGLDARLLTEEKADYLAHMRLRQPHFAMDTMEQMETVARGLRLYRDAYRRVHGNWNWRYAMVYCLTNYDTTFDQDMERIKLIQECDCWPFVMVYNKPNAPLKTIRLQRWTNNPVIYGKTHDFYDFYKTMY